MVVLQSLYELFEALKW